MTRSSDVVVLGGGAAGLMCAAEAGRRGRRVVLLEHSEQVGRKILISGGGRCNFTNLHTTPDHFLSTNPPFCRSALARYAPADFIDLVERHGIAWHEKERGQLFCDGPARQIVELLLAECGRSGVRIETACTVTAVAADAGGFRLETSRGTIRAAALVVATGGLSVPQMGATDFGHRIARQFGHAIVEPRPALVPFVWSPEDLALHRDLSGVSVAVAAGVDGTRFSGGMLFTHRGVSGPAILQISSYWRPGDAVHVDLLPDADAAAWLEARRRDRPGAELKTVLAERLPRRLAERLVVPAFDSRPMGQCSGPELKAMAARLHDWSFHPAATEGYRTAEVTLGGVDTRGLSSTTMESRHQPGLYFIGEVVDVTGHLGGFNFQWAWASGQAAGSAV